MIDPDDPYAAIPELYDLQHGAFGDDIDLYLNLARTSGGPVLELGCGTGRLLVPLAEAGYRVTGLDRSRPMLDRAQSAVAAADLTDRVTLYPADMGTADRAPGGPFGLVIVPLNGLMHVSSGQDQRQVLTAARRALRPNGQIVLDLPNPTPDALRSLDQSLSHDGTWHRSDGTRVDRFASRRITASEQLIEEDIWYDELAGDGTPRRTAASYRLRYLHAAELELLLELTGFATWHLYGSYELDPFDDGAERLIAVAQTADED